VIETRETLRIATLGTSLTARGGWVDVLASALEPCIDRAVRVSSFARVGATSRWGLEIIDQVIQVRPDVVLVEFASNDAALHRRVSRAESAANMTAIIRRLRHGNPDSQLYLMTMSPARGIRGLMRPLLPAYYGIYPRLARQELTGFIDNRPDWHALSRAELTRALPDGAHPIAEFALSITLANVLPVLARDLNAAAQNRGAALRP
jgi:acyl-CoA thioesterase I